MYKVLLAGALFGLGLIGSAHANEGDLVFARKTVTLEAPITGAGEALRLLAPDTDTLIVRTRDDEARHAFHLFSAASLASDTPGITHTVAVPDNAIFYALGEMPDGEMEKLLIFDQTGIHAYDPASNGFTALVETRSLFRQGTSLRFQKAGFARDLNDDGRFDLLVQDFDGLKLYFQRADGGFSTPTLIPVEPEMRLTGSFSNDNISDTAFSAPVTRTPSFNIFPSYIADSTGDGQSDLAFLIGRSLHIFAQTGPETYATQPVIVDFRFDVRGNRWRDEILSQEQNVDQSNFSETTIYRILDINGDGALDVVTVSNQASGLLDRDQIFHAYFGTMSDGRVNYPSVPDQTFDFGGIGGVGFRDVNDDGRKDFVLTSTQISIGKIISFLINRKVTTRTQIYIDDGSGQFEESRDFRRNRTFRLDLSRGQTINPPFDYADFNGDGAIDLMEANSKGRMKILAGGGGENFQREMAEIREVFPNDGSLVVAEDINNDGKADIIVRYNQFGLDGENKARELVLHLSQPVP